MMCDQCAFRRGCETWHEPRNHVVSQICAAGPLPFFCHANLAWRDALTHVLPVKLLAATTPGGLRVCEGWKRAVAERRWPTDPSLRRYQQMLAWNARSTAERFLVGQVSTRELHRDLAPLAEFYHGPRAWQIERMLRRKWGMKGAEG